MAARRTWCIDCEKLELPLTRKASPPGPRCATHKRALKKKSADTRHTAHILATYKMTTELYDEIYEFQGGRCAICRFATGKSRKLSVDHDHKCCPGRVTCGRCTRGLLCRPCNTLLGRARDAIEFFRRAIDYLNDPPAQRVLNRRRKNR